MSNEVTKVELVMSTEGQDLERQNVPIGHHRCAIKSIIDFGEQQTEWGLKKQIELVFEFPEHMGIFKDEQELPLFIAKRYTLSLHPKSSLAKNVTQMFGLPLPANFDVYSLIGKNLMANVIHVKKDGVTYANCDSFAPLSAGLSHIEQEDQMCFLMGMEGQSAALDLLPDWKAARIRGAKDYIDMPF